MNDETKEPNDPVENHDEEGISRRNFLTVAGAFVGAVAAAQITATPLLGKGLASHGGGSESPYKWGMVIDTNKCIGCNYCTYACQAVNDLPPDMQYNVVTTEYTQNGDEFFLARPCLHCENPPCVQVCPVGATYLRDDGIVTMDYDLCIGCRYCEVACPYGARVFNWKDNSEVENTEVVPAFGFPEVESRPRGVMEKCTFCQHRIDDGLARGLMPGVDEKATPACINICPTGARIFGNLNDPESPASVALQENSVTFTLRPELSTNPKVYYIPPANKSEES